MVTLIGQVEAFQPGVDDWEQYTERLGQYFAANGIEDDDKKFCKLLKSTVPCFSGCLQLAEAVT